MTAPKTASDQTRRAFLGFGAAAASWAAASVLGAPAFAQDESAGPFVQPALGFPDNALSPVISSRTVELHYARHHAGYFRNLNRLVAGTPYAEMSLEEVVIGSAFRPTEQALYNNAGQAWNHVQYWEMLRPRGPDRPDGALLAALEERFGGYEGFSEQFISAAGQVFGSGWVWLVDGPGGLTITGTRNGATPLALGGKPLLGIDLWEHAYYLDYQNRRADHVQAVLERLVNWRVVAERFAA